MAEHDPLVRIAEFEGLNNKEDRASLGPQWFEQLDDWDIDDGKNLQRRPGYSLLVANIADIYSTDDGGDAYLIRNTDNALLRLFEDGTTGVLYANVGLGPYYWTEMGRNVYLNTASAAFEIRPDGVWAWNLNAPAAPSLTAGAGVLPAGVYKVALTYIRSDGVESPASPAQIVTVAAGGAIQIAAISVLSGHDTAIYVSPPDGDQLYLYRRTTTTGLTVDGDPTDWTYPLRTRYRNTVPLGVPVAQFDGRIWAAVTDTVHGFTRLFGSDQLRPWYFEYDPENPVDIADTVVTIVGTPQGLLVGCESGLYSVTVTEDGFYVVRQLALYGAIKSAYDVDEEGRAYIWTVRGVVRAFPFENLTESRLRADAGNEAACLIRDYGGYQTLLVSPRGSSGTFNPYVGRISPTLHDHNIVAPGESGFFLLLESGDALLLESGDKLILES